MWAADSTIKLMIQITIYSIIIAKLINLDYNKLEKTIKVVIVWNSLQMKVKM